MFWMLKLPIYFASLLTDGLRTKVTPIVLNSPPQSLPKAQEQSVVAGRNDRFACEIVFAKYDLPAPEDFEIYGVRVVGTVPDLFAKCVPEHDIVNPLLKEDEKVKQCAEGIWMAYIQGDIWWEPNINLEFGGDDGDWVFNSDEGYPRYIPLSVVSKKVETAIPEMSLKEYLAKLRTGGNEDE